MNANDVLLLGIIAVPIPNSAPIMLGNAKKNLNRLWAKIGMSKS